MRLIQRLSDRQIVLLGVLLTLILGFLFIGAKDFFLDEIASLLVVKNASTLRSYLWNEEGNMWLYYGLLFLWSKIGTSETIVRSLSVIFAAASIPSIFYVTKELFHRKAAIIILTLLPLHVFFISNAQNARSYSLLLLLTTSASYFFVKYVHAPKWKYLVTYILLITLAVYAHIYALFVLMSHLLSYFILSPRKSLKTAILILPIVMILILPFILSPSISSHTQNIHWIPKPGIRNIIGTYILLANDFLPQAILSGILILFLFFKTMKNRFPFKQWIVNNWSLIFITLGIIVPISAAFVVSYITTPIYTSTYFFISLVSFQMLISVALAAIKRKWVFRVTFTLLILLYAVRLYGWYAQIPSLSLGIANNNDEWRKTAQFLTSNAKPTDAVIFFPTYGEKNVEIYTPKNTQVNYTPINLQPDPFSGGNPNTPFNEKLLLSIPKTYKSVWYVFNDYTDATRLPQQRTIEKVLKANYQETGVTNYFRIKIFHFVKSQ